MAAKKGIILDIPLFEGNIEVFTDRELTVRRLIELGIVKKIRKQKELTFINQVHGCVYYDVKDDLLIVVYLPEEYNDVTVSHEVIHIVTTFYKYFNLPAPKEGKDEFFARYHDYFMEQIKSKVYGL